MKIKQLTVLGVGLIGGSLARAVKQKNICEDIIGFGRSEENLRKAIELGVIDDYTTDVAQAVQGADVIVLATPPGTTESLLQGIKGSIKACAIVTDVGSVKGNVATMARKCLTAEQLKNFVPGHPIAGTEQSGVAASFAELFNNHLVILTPLQETDEASVSFVSQLWMSVGARVTTMTIAHHDAVLAATSHLPHMLAFALVDCLASMQDRKEIFQYAAGGFADFTRIASSSPQMWNDICISNRDDLLKVLERFDGHLADIKIAIESGDSSALLEIFNRAKQARDEFATAHVIKNNAIE